MANKKITELTSATLPLSGTEEIAIVQGGETKKVAISEVGGASLRCESYEWRNGTNTFATTSNWYGARYNVANTLPTPLWSSGENYYDGTLNTVNNVRTPSYIVGFQQKIERLSISYATVSISFTFRLVYFELNPSGSSNVGVNASILHEATISANTGGIKKQEIFLPTAFTASQNGYFAVFILNNSGSTLTAPSFCITANAIEVL